MNHLAPALDALASGDRERAKAILVQAYDQAPGGSALLLARIALEEEDFKRAEILSRTAIENHERAAAITLADAVGRQGRRDEAEQIAMAAMSSLPDSGLLRAVLGEQRIRQASWDLGTQDFVDAFSLDGRPDVVRHLERVLRDLTAGHKAGKVPVERASAFVDRIEAGAPRNDDDLAQLLASVRQALGDGAVLGRIKKRARPAPPPMPPDARTRRPTPASAPPRLTAPGLGGVLRRDRALNETLQEGIDFLGLPKWPSENGEALDRIPAMVPAMLDIDRDEFQREQLNVTSGSVASEIVIERALQSLLRAIETTTASAPPFDSAGLTQLEVALWDGALEAMKPIPAAYQSETEGTDAERLAIGAFLAGCILEPGSATWSFERDPAASIIETYSGDLEPFDIAARWLAAEDKDDVHLEGFLGEALQAGLDATAERRHDPTEGLDGQALAMKLAALWLDWRCNALDTPQNEVAAAIRPLNNLGSLRIFAIDSDYAPAPTWLSLPRKPKQIPIAFVRPTGEFLYLMSRKHFARAAGYFVDDLHANHAGPLLDMFEAFHRPSSKVVRSGEDKPRIENRRGAKVLRFVASVAGTPTSYALVNAPAETARWILMTV